LRSRNASEFLDSILQDGTRLISAANALETGIVLKAKRGEGADREFDLFLVRADLQLISVDLEQVDIARSAWQRYGKGHHWAALNCGDCFAYALAKSSGEPLLAKDTGFTLTDVALSPCS
jgi:ribonuclease VapC